MPELYCYSSTFNFLSYTFLNQALYCYCKAVHSSTCWGKHYIKDYGIIAKPLHDITKKGATGPPPWIKGTSYDLGSHIGW